MTPTYGTLLTVATTVVLATVGTTLGTVLYLGDDCEHHAATGLDYRVCGPDTGPTCIGTPHQHAWESTDAGGVRRVTTYVFGVQVASTRGHCHGTLLLDSGTHDSYTAHSPDECPDASVLGLVWINDQFGVGCGDPCTTDLLVDEYQRPCIIPLVDE